MRICICQHSHGAWAVGGRFPQCDFQPIVDLHPCLPSRLHGGAQQGLSREHGMEERAIRAAMTALRSKSLTPSNERTFRA